MCKWFFRRLRIYWLHLVITAAPEPMCSCTVSLSPARQGTCMTASRKPSCPLGTSQSASQKWPLLPPARPTPLLRSHHLVNKTWASSSLPLLASPNNCLTSVFELQPSLFHLRCHRFCSMFSPSPFPVWIATCHLCASVCVRTCDPALHLGHNLY